MKDYKKMMGGSKQKLMKNHGNTSPIKSDAQKFDMGRMQMKSHEGKGHNQKAFDYKY